MVVWCLRRVGETYTDLVLARRREGKKGHDNLFSGKLHPEVPCFARLLLFAQLQYVFLNFLNIELNILFFF